MKFYPPNTYSVGRRIGGGVLAAVFGLLTPLIALLQMSTLMPLVLLSGFIMVWLNGHSGRTSAALFMAVQMSSTAVLLGIPFMWMFFVAGTVPAIVTMRGIAMKRPFFDQMRDAVVMYVLGMLGALLVGYAAFGGNMIGKFIDAMRTQIYELPSEVLKPFVDGLNAMIAAQPGSGLKMFTVDAYRDQMSGILVMLGETYANLFPGMMFSGAVLNAVISVHRGNLMSAKRGFATDESFVDFERWFLPPQTTLWLSLMWLTGYMLVETGYTSGEAVYNAVYYLFSTVMGIQGVAAIDRYLSRHEVNKARRRRLCVVLIALGLVVRLLNMMLFVIGVASAFFGSHSPLRTARNRKKNDQSGDDDPEQ